MQAEQTNDPKVMVLKLSLDEATRIGALIDRFVIWDVMGSEPIETYLVDFGRDCRQTRSNPLRKDATGEHQRSIRMSPLQVQVLGEFLTTSVDVMGNKLGWTEKVFLSLTADTLRTNVTAHLQHHGLLGGRSTPPVEMPVPNEILTVPG